MATVGNQHGRLVLVVDDEPAILRAVTAVLAMAGFRAIVAENGAAGLNAFLAFPDEIDLVLSDIIMPVMDGTAMAVAIRKAHPNARILLMTGYADQRERAHGLNALIHDVISKPFTLSQIRAAVNDALGQRTDV
jgi:DNA-binding response OmpR family regulator